MNITQDDLVNDFVNEVVTNHGENAGYFSEAQLKRAGITSPEQIAEKVGEDATYEWSPEIVEEAQSRAADYHDLKIAVASGRITQGDAAVRWEELHGTPEGLARVRRELAEAAWNHHEVSLTPEQLEPSRRAFNDRVKAELFADPQYRRLCNIEATLQAMRRESEE